ncbi:MAG: T9SS type A sorting domain-containing protein [Bacteroidetes bacterium]|nr:T9SS type A sorting domain-containing protein [Bacteroidota bacterium]
MRRWIIPSENIGPPSITYNYFNTDLPYDIHNESNEAIRVENFLGNVSPYTNSNEINNTILGVRLANCNGARIRFTTYLTNVPNVDLPAFASNHMGIWATNCNSTQIAFNNIVHPTSELMMPTEATLLQGINIQDCQSAVIQSNNTDRLGTDINVVLDCFASSITCNNMANSHRGINFDAATLTNMLFYPADQSSTDNTWTGEYLSNTNERISGDFNPIAPIDWHHQGDENASNNFCPFYRSAAIEPAELSPSNGCVEESPEEYAYEQANNAAQNSSNYFYNVTANRYKDDAAAFELFTTDSILKDSLTNQYPYLSTWYNALKLTNIGKFEDLKKLLMEDNQQQAINKVNAIGTNTNFYLNLKLIGALYAQHLLISDSIPSENSIVNAIDAIANQDPTIGGEAVYIARAILRKDITDSYSIIRTGVTDSLAKTNKDVLYRIFPNPTFGLLNIESNLKFDLIIIDDLLGVARLRYVEQKSLNNSSINLSSLSAGFYIVKILNENIVKQIFMVNLIK